MTFDEWREWQLKEYGEEPIPREAWQAAQREAAKRCVEICLESNGWLEPALEDIRREFNL